ncbi:MAG: ATP-dependent helicase [Deltaproteobacteria bacterium]|nr:ATP-dependent helicase [Deltaproteobacteria bacterium]
MKRYLLSSPPADLQVDYEKDLNASQLEAVRAGPGPVLIIAGAGTGKTRTLTYRVAYLIEQGLAADSIALCTFTNKAAREMLRRVEHLVQEEARRVWGGTFHHLANRLLRIHAQEAGFPDGYTILDQEDARDLLDDCIAARGERDERIFMSSGALNALLGLAANTGRPLEELVPSCAPELVSRLEEILELAEDYRQRKQKMALMDFDDLLTRLYALLAAGGELAERIAGRFQHVLVDEYQDISRIQAEIVDLLAAAHGNLTVVGDDAQSIYSFRGADPDITLTFEQRWPGARLVKLEDNYRSSPEILALANRSIAFNLRQIPKALRATRPAGEMPARIVVRDAGMQAELVCQRIAELFDEGTPLAEMAVLYRSHHDSMELQVELTRRKIPFSVRSGLRFFEQAHIKDVLAHLRLVENPKDALSWLRVLKLQAGIGRRSAARIWEVLEGDIDPLQAALSDAPSSVVHRRARQSWNRLRELLVLLDADEIRSQPGQAIQAVLEHGYADHLADLYPNSKNRLEDLVSLAAYAERFEDRVSFLSELNLLASFAAEEVLDPGRPEDRLVLSTVHQAKGLEWDAVFVIGLNEGRFPHYRAQAEPGGLDEERRLFYVAVTRARRLLHLLSCQIEDRPGRRQLISKASRFLVELPDRVTEIWRVERGG